MNPLKIFVSHTWADKNTHDHYALVCRELKGYDLWLDKEQLAVGEFIQQELKQAIADSDIFLILWSKHAGSPQHKDVQLEFHTAIELGKTIIPCIIDVECMSPDHSHEAYSVHSSPFFQANNQTRFYLDLTDQNPIGFIRLREIVLQKEQEKMEQQGLSPENQEQLQELKESMKLVTRMRSHAEDSSSRMKGGATNRNQFNAYTANNLDMLIEFFSAPPTDASKQQVLEFLQFAKQTMAQYPNDDATTVKLRETLMYQKLQAIDPNQQNATLQDLKRIFQPQEMATENLAPEQDTWLSQTAAPVQAAYRSEVQTQVSGSYEMVKKMTGGFLPDMLFKPLFASMETFFHSSVYLLDMLCQSAAQNPQDLFLRDCLDQLLKYLQGEGQVVQNQGNFGILGYSDDAYLILWITENLARKGHIDYSTWQVDWNDVNTGCNQVMNLAGTTVKEALDNGIYNLFTGLEQQHNSPQPPAETDLEMRRRKLQESSNSLLEAKIMSLKTAAGIW